MSRNPKALVLGASGGIGGEVARQLRDGGWQVHALRRNPATSPPSLHGLTWHQGDAMSADDVARAAAGCEVIVHAVNPPGYRNWSELVLPMLDNTIAAARVQGATIVLPGTVYNFSPDEPGPLGENAPQRAATRKGRIRCEMERRLESSTVEGARALIVRAGDFFGPEAVSNWFSQGLIQAGRPVAVINQPGREGVGHQWGYVPDVARSMVELLSRRDTLPAFARFHVGGHWDPDGMTMARTIQTVVARHTARTPGIRPLPWWLFDMASPFVTLFREMREMRYLWQRPVQLDGRLLAATLGRDPQTAWEVAVEATLKGLGCLR